MLARDDKGTECREKTVLRLGRQCANSGEVSRRQCAVQILAALESTLVPEKILSTLSGEQDPKKQGHPKYGCDAAPENTSFVQGGRYVFARMVFEEIG